MKTVSVIVPVYNCAEYIRESLYSAIHQTYPSTAVEIIVVDDGSTDNTLEIIKEISCHRSNMRVFSQSNQGPSAARNFGLSQARGDYIQFLDADDIILPLKLEKQIALLEQNPHIIACHCNYVQFSNHNELDNYYIQTKFNSENQLVEVLTRWSHSLMIPPIVMLFRSSLLQKSQIYWDNQLWRSEDWNLYLQTLLAGHKFIHIHELLAMHRGRPTSLSQDRVKMAISDLRVLDKLEHNLNNDTTINKQNLVEKVRQHAKSRLGYALLGYGHNQESFEILLESIQKDSWKYQIKSLTILIFSIFIQGSVVLNIWHVLGHIYKESKGHIGKIFLV
jgi:glycosyltransferase involved in cell wall biosynthesis